MEEENNVVNKEVSESVVDRLTALYCSNKYTYMQISAMYKTCDDELNQRALERALVVRMSKNVSFHDRIVLEKLFENLSIEQLWVLGNSEDKYIKSRARNTLFDRISGVEEVYTVICDENDKVMSKKRLVNLKRREDK